MFAEKLPWVAGAMLLNSSYLGCIDARVEQQCALPVDRTLLQEEFVFETDMDKTFDKYEVRGAYHWDWYRTNKDSYRDLVDLTISQFPEPGSVLDVGCGDGIPAYILHSLGFSVHGVDLSHTAIDLAQRLAIDRATRDGIASWLPLILARCCPEFAKLRRRVSESMSFEAKSLFELPDEAYDYVLMQEVIEHIPDARGAVEKIAALTQRCAVVTAPNGQYMPKHELDYHSWTSREFIELFTGFDVEMVYEDKRYLIVKLTASSQVRAIAGEE